MTITPGNSNDAEIQNVRAQIRQWEGNLSALDSAIDIAQDAVKAAKDRVKEIENKVSRTSANYNRAAQDYDKASEKYSAFSENCNRLSAVVNRASAIYSECSVAYQEASAEVSLAKNKVSNYESQLENINAQIESNTASVGTAEYTLSDWNSQVNDAKSAYDEAEDRYIESMKSAASQQALNSKEGAAYNVAMNNYTTELSARRNLDDSVIQLMAQVAAEQGNLDTQNDALRAQFESAKASSLEQLDREIENYDRQIREHTVCSTLNGRVTAVNVMKGSYLQQAMTVCKVEADGSGDEIMCYIPVSEGRKIETEDRVIVYPSTYNRQEYGHMEGIVTSVSEEPASALNMGIQLGDDSLVQMFQQNGPVLTVICKLNENPDTLSGYWWSNKKGEKEAAINQGTLISADVIVDEKAPITMLIPYLKEKWAGIVKNDSQQNS